MTEPRVAPKGVLLLACALATATAWAQPAVPSASAASAAEKAQKETDRTMYWIRVLASKPAPVKPGATPAPVAAQAPAPRPAPTVATAAAPPKAAAESRDKPKAAAPPPATVVAAAEPAAAPTTAPAAAPVGKPAVASQAPGGEVSEPVSPRVDNGVDAGTPATPAAPAAAPAPVVAPAEDDLDPGLVQIAAAQPEFPPAVVRKVHKGNVEVRFEVEPGGKVVEATVVESSHPRLNDAAIEAVKKWRFKPGTRYHTAAVNLKFDIDTE